MDSWCDLIDLNLPRFFLRDHVLIKIRLGAVGPGEVANASDAARAQGALVALAWAARLVACCHRFKAADWPGTAHTDRAMEYTGFGAGACANCVFLTKSPLPCCVATASAPCFCATTTTV